MSNTDERIIPLSKSKLLVLLIGAGGFVALGAWLFQMGQQEAGLLRAPLAVVQAVGLAGILFFGFCGLVGLKKLFATEPGLVLDSTGILDNSSAISAGFVPWADIAGFGIFQVHNTRTLVIQVFDIDKYANRGSAMQRALKKTNVRLCGSPVAVSPSALKIDFDELLRLCEDYLARYGRGAAA
jgi:hypothetical protein